MSWALCGSRAASCIRAARRSSSLSLSVMRGQFSRNHCIQSCSARAITGSTSHRVLSRSKATARIVFERLITVMSEFHLIIGNKNYSSWSLRPWILMTHLGVQFRETIVPLDTPQFKDQISRCSPSGRVPVLQHGELTVWDSLAICEYIVETVG